MKIKLLSFAGALLAVLAALIIKINNNHSVNANQNGGGISKKVSSFPKSMRGTWYAYDSDASKKSPQFVITKITKNKIANKQPELKGVYVSYLHKFYKHSGSAHSNWIYTIGGIWTKFDNRRYDFIHTYEWNQNNGDGDYWNVSTQNGHRVLTLVGGAGLQVSDHSYRSKTLAKSLAKERYQGFLYSN